MQIRHDNFLQHSASVGLLFVTAHTNSAADEGADDYTVFWVKNKIMIFAKIFQNVCQNDKQP